MKKLIIKDKPNFKMVAVEKEPGQYTVYTTEEGKPNQKIMFYKSEILQLIKWIIGKN